LGTPRKEIGAQRGAGPLEALEKVFERPPDLSIRKTDISVELMELYANEELL
jgi:hypothetical protein